MPTRPHHQRLDFDNGVCELYCIISEDDDAARIHREIAGVEYMADHYGGHESFQLSFCKNGQENELYLVKLFRQQSSFLFIYGVPPTMLFVHEQNLQHIAAAIADELATADFVDAVKAYAANVPDMRYPSFPQLRQTLAKA